MIIAYSLCIYIKRHFSSLRYDSIFTVYTIFLHQWKRTNCTICLQNSIIVLYRWVTVVNKITVIIKVILWTCSFCVHSWQTFSQEQLFSANCTRHDWLVWPQCCRWRRTIKRKNTYGWCLICTSCEHILMIELLDKKLHDVAFGERK